MQKAGEPMYYKILMLNVSAPVSVGQRGYAKYTPWGDLTPNRPITTPASSTKGLEFRPEASFRLETPQLQHIVIKDDDPYLHEGIISYDEKGQLLVSKGITFGDGTAFDEATQLASMNSARLIDEDGNIFRVQFPMRFISGEFGALLGGRQSVLVFPEPRLDASGNEVLPEFDPSKMFNLLDFPRFDRTNQQSLPQYRVEVQCFAQGTRIQTASGPRTIETLSPDDLVLTRDNGLQPIRWINGTYLSAGRLDLQPNLRPIQIKAGALGVDTPAQDLIVSPQHRILVDSKIARRMFNADEILVAAKHLVSLDGIRVLNPKNGISYWHMLFDQHEIVLSNGSWSESLFTGPQALKAVSASARREILSLFPQLANPDYRSQTARRILSGREGRKLVERHLKHGRPLLGEI